MLCKIMKIVIHPYIFYTAYPLQLAGELEAIPADFGGDAKYTR